MNSTLDIKKTVEGYLERQDWRVNANANQGYSVGGLLLNGSGTITGNYWLDHVYPPDVSNLHRSGGYYIHDLDMLSGYCAGWSLRNLLNEGFNGVEGKISSGPPSHFRSALGQMVNFLGTLQNEWAGAQAFSSMDTLLAPFVFHDSLTYEEVKQGVQEFIFNMNVPSRWGNQTPFSNVTFDLVCPDDLKDTVVLIGGRETNYTYGMFQEQMDMINTAFLEVMIGGDSKGRVFPFPIPTYNITKDFKWDSKVSDLIFTLSAKYGLPYFQNFLSSDLKPSDVRSMCCRLTLSLSELRKRGGGLFGSAEQTGSIGVVTINLPRIAYIADGDTATFKVHLEYLLGKAKESLEIKRTYISELLDRGLYPFTKRYLGTFRNHFSTIGVIGMNEAILAMTNEEEDITTEKGRDFAENILHFIRAKLKIYQEETGNMYNLEATPAEGASHRLARADQRDFGYDKEYYTNSSQLPVDYTSDPFEACDLQEELQSLYTGGTVLHFYTGENMGMEGCKKFVKKVLENYRIPYITVSPVFSVCPDHGYIEGRLDKCPRCGRETEVWTRVMGYHRPMKAYNTGKKQEHSERRLFNLKKG